MNTKPPIELGYIQRKHGVHGEVIALLYREVTNLRHLWLQIDHTLVPYAIENISYQHPKAIIKLKGVEQPEAAHELKGSNIFVPEKDLSEVAPRTEQCLDSLLGYQVEDLQLGALGTICNIEQLPLQQLLVVEYRNKELLIPYHEDFVRKTDHDQCKLTIELPRGFIETSF